VLHIRRMCWKFCDWNWIDMAAGGGGWKMTQDAPQATGA
jgi:hypothetical protein